MMTPYQPDIITHNTATFDCSVWLTCPLDSGHHLQSARSHEQCNVECLQLLAELDHANISIIFITHLKLVHWAIITLSVLRTYGTAYILFTRMYQCQRKPYSKCWMMVHGKVSWPSKGYLWLRIAASGPHPQTDLYIYFLIAVNANIYYTYICISFFLFHVFI